MNRCEKIAWFNLAVLAVSCVLYLLLFLFLKTKYGFPLNAQVASSAFSIVALCAFGPFIFKNRSIQEKPGSIARPKHGLNKFILFWGVYTGIFISIWVWIRYVGHGTLSDQLNVLIVFIYVSTFVLFAFILKLSLKKQKESGLIIGEYSITDVLLYGPDMDERDMMIQKKARWSGFGAFWLCYVFGFVGTYACLLFKGYRSISIHISVLPLFVFGAFWLILTVDSITTVIFYRRGK